MVWSKLLNPQLHKFMLIATIHIVVVCILLHIVKPKVHSPVIIIFNNRQVTTLFLLECLNVLFKVFLFKGFKFRYLDEELPVLEPDEGLSNEPIPFPCYVETSAWISLDPTKCTYIYTRCPKNKLKSLKVAKWRKDEWRMMITMMDEWRMMKDE